MLCSITPLDSDGLTSVRPSSKVPLFGQNDSKYRYSFAFGLAFSFANPSL
jgi:hypothetical protein